MRVSLKLYGLFNPVDNVPIQAVGVGIAAGAMVASTSGLATEPWQSPSRDRLLLPPHPLMLALLASVLCSLGASWIAQQLIQKRRLSTITLKNHQQWRDFQRG